MDRQPIVIFFTGQLLEILDGERCVTLVEFKRHLPWMLLILADLEGDERHVVSTRRQEAGAEKGEDDEDSFHETKGSGQMVTTVPGASAGWARSSPAGEPRLR